VRAAGKAGVLKSAGVEVTRPGTLGGDLQRLDPLANEPQGLAKRTPEGPERAQFLDVLDDRSSGAVIELTRSRGGALEECARDLDDRLQ
jgi:hypothetical protein